MHYIEEKPYGHCNWRKCHCSDSCGHPHLILSQSIQLWIMKFKVDEESASGRKEKRENKKKSSVLEFVLLYLQENKKVNYMLFVMVLSSGMQKLVLIFERRDNNRQEECLEVLYTCVCFQTQICTPWDTAFKMSIAELNKELEKAFSPGEGGDGDPIALVCYRFS